MPGIVSYGTYIPRTRLDRSAASATLGLPEVRGLRAVANYDEDTTTMGVEAARRATDDQKCPTELLFVTTSPAYADKSNAATIHAALGLPAEVTVTDLGATIRAAAAAFRIGMSQNGANLAVFADIQVGLPGGPDEREGGDGSAAFLLTAGDEPVIAELAGRGCVTTENLERWRLPTTAAAQRWDDQFGAAVGAPSGEAAFNDALKASGLTADSVDCLAVAGLNPRTVRTVLATLGVRRDIQADDLGQSVGVAGAAHPGLLLAAMLDKSQPGQHIVLVIVGDGAEAFAFRTTDHIATRRQRPSLAQQIETEALSVPYGRYLQWRGLLSTEPSRTAPPRGISVSAAHREARWKLAFVASRCRTCGTRHLPPQRVCLSCRSEDMESEGMSDVHGSIKTYTTDRLAWSPSGPATFAVVDFDGGGRAELELTELGDRVLAPGLAVEPTFRRVHSCEGRHNYFWKARPVTEEKPV